MESSSALPSGSNSFLSEAVAKPQDSHVNFAMSYIPKDLFPSSHVLTIFWPQLYIRLEAETNYIKMSWKTVRIYLNFLLLLLLARGVWHWSKMLAGILSLPNESVSLYSLMHTQTCEFAKSLLAHEL